MFDQNCPAFFAENERADYAEFLAHSIGSYWVVLLNHSIAAAFGLVLDSNHNRCRITWIMVSPGTHGSGVGSKMMNRAIELARGKEAAVVDIAASHISAPFFSRFGAIESKRTENGWGDGMHRVDMELLL